MRALNTRLTKLRRDAPGSLRQEDVANRMTRLGYKCVTGTVGDYERGKMVDEDGEFSKYFARAIGADFAVVRRAHAATHRAWKKSGGRDRVA